MRCTSQKVFTRTLIVKGLRDALNAWGYFTAEIQINTENVQLIQLKVAIFHQQIEFVAIETKRKMC